MNLRDFTFTIKRFRRCVIRTWKKLSLFSRSLILLISKSLVASFILGQLTPIATAYYAMSLGFRVPIEGVQYVSAAMATLTFLGFLATGLCMFYFVVNLRQAAFVIRISSYLTKKLPWLPASVALPIEQILSAREAWLVLIASAIICTVLFVYVYSYTTDDPNYILVAAFALICSSIVIVALAVFANLASFFQFQVGLSAVVLLVSIVCLFNVGLYGSFLRVIRYGGGIEYEVQLTQSTTPALVRGFLLIQNDQMVVLMSADKTSVIEIPTRLIETRRTPISPEWQLPTGTLAGQARYLRFP